MKVIYVFTACSEVVRSCRHSEKAQLFLKAFIQSYRRAFILMQCFWDKLNGFCRWCCVVFLFPHCLYLKMKDTLVCFCIHSTKVDWWALQYIYFFLMYNCNVSHGKLTLFLDLALFWPLLWSWFRSRHNLNQT